MLNLNLDIIYKHKCQTSKLNVNFFTRRSSSATYEKALRCSSLLHRPLHLTVNAVLLRVHADPKILIKT